jgi:hypothetical protein
VQGIAALSLTEAPRHYGIGKSEQVNPITEEVKQAIASNYSCITISSFFLESVD